MRKSLNIVANIIICLLVGFIGSLFQKNALLMWYPSLHKSMLTPPNYVFPLVWCLLYILMGISIALITNKNEYCKKNVLGIYTIQLFLNLCWSIVFFYLRNPLYGFIVIIILYILIIIYAVKTYPLSKTASILFYPYILWLTLASYLNLYILLFN